MMHCYRYIFIVFLFVSVTIVFSLNFPTEISLSSAKEHVHTVANLIYHRYELNRSDQFQLFMTLLNMPDNSWNILKNKIISSILQGGNFTMVFGGTGVTAGFDNYLHQSYPMIVERRLKPIFSSFGVDLIIRNIAQIHVECKLSNYCFEALGGKQADWIGWENSFDCGNAKDSHEFIARLASSQKAVLFYSTSGSFLLSDCPPSQDKVPYISEEWAPDIAGISRRIKVNRKDVRDFQSLHQRWNSAGSSAGRFTRSLGKGYEGVGAHGFSPWTITTMHCDTTTTTISNSSSRGSSGSSSAVMSDTSAALYDTSIQYESVRRLQGEQHNSQHMQRLRRKRSKPLLGRNITSNTPNIGTNKPICEAVKLKGLCQTQGGAHWRTKEAGDYGNSLKTGRKWHPSVGMHMLRAEVMIYTYLHVILDALYTIEERKTNATEQQRPVLDGPQHKNRWFRFAKKDVASVEPPRADAFLSEIKHVLHTLQVPVPSTPMHCTMEECPSPSLSLPQCYTNYEPNYSVQGSSQLGAIRVGETLGWYEEAAVANDAHPELGLLDKKYYYKSEGAKNEIFFQLQGVRSAVRLYARSAKLPLTEALFLIDPHINVLQNPAEFKTPANYRPRIQRYMLVPGETVNISSTGESVHLYGLPAGDHILTVMSAPANPFALTSLTHIVIF